MSIFPRALMGAQPGPDSGRPPAPYDWASKPPTEDTEAASAQVLRDLSRPRR